MAAIKALGHSCFLIENALTTQEQNELFHFIHERDATNWDNVPSCMNPTPKTLELFVCPVEASKGAATARSIWIQQKEGQPKQVATELVEKAVSSIIAETDSNNGGPISQLHQPIRSISLSVIRYCIKGSSSTVGSILPPHVDHCNDGSWVVLFSLGCSVDFFVQCQNEEHRHNFKMESGDVIMFDPSSKARILHGVNGVVPGSGACTEMMLEEGGPFGVLRKSRFGVQCRVSFDG